ncbi:hypothetical protein PR202_gb19602 [Eleusine coracana subsp. coracana]|uniref:Anaphase-promoting complex subunit 11 RING-H2 finger domain-containing protein n=1 Tax=Eleusine coracana subsp. coracana TaxID=191504 RepID=A0AAV5F8N8_ELECO|nr:hypothetical protein PR202_gb19602 [Eleusine coracana subsp. coracana]
MVRSSGEGFTMKVKILQWHAVASWTWDAQDETCGICRMAFDGCCPDSAESACDGDDEICGCAGDEEEEQLLERAMAEARRASTATNNGDGAEDAGVDVKAEEFIARFYAQMKLQRQISWIQYNEMMQRSVS